MFEYKLQLSENKKELDLFKSNIYKLTDDDIVNANGNHLIAITTNDNEAPRSSDEKMTTDELGSNIQGALEISSALKFNRVHSILRNSWKSDEFQLNSMKFWACPGPAPWSEW